MAERTANPEAILRRFARSNVQHPTYKALIELGRHAIYLRIPTRL